uniref:Uncharacterized protein n=1 Tax=Rhipicephalus appendiculatus TaxID=34631 RepID=A0A131YBZ4_RHIAP
MYFIILTTDSSGRRKKKQEGSIPTSSLTEISYCLRKCNMQVLSFFQLQAHKMNSTAVMWFRKRDSYRNCNKQERKINYDNTPIHIYNKK